MPVEIENLPRLRAMLRVSAVYEFCRSIQSEVQSATTTNLCITQLTTKSNVNSNITQTKLVITKAHDTKFDGNFNITHTKLAITEAHEQGMYCTVS